MYFLFWRFKINLFVSRKAFYDLGFSTYISVAQVSVAYIRQVSRSSFVFVCVWSVENAAEDNPVRPYILSRRHTVQKCFFQTLHCRKSADGYSKLSSDGRRDFFPLTRYEMFREKERCILTEVVISLVELKPLYFLHFNLNGYLASRLETIIHSAF